MAQTELSPEKRRARVAAGAALTMAAGHSSESLDRFGSWFLAAFGAGLAFAISHSASESSSLPLVTVSQAAHLFLIATVLCVAQRYVSTVVTTGAKSAKDARELNIDISQIDIHELLVQLAQGYPWPLRIICDRHIQTLLSGDLAAAGRIFTRLALFQGLLVALEVGVLLWALSKMINDIGA
jgi:hypothetical protein